MLLLNLLPPMKLSSSVHPHLVGELLRTLANMGIDTIRQLLARDPHLLAARTGLDLNPVRDIRCTCLAAFPQGASHWTGAETPQGKGSRVHLECRK